MNDDARLVANSATFDQADRVAAGLNWLFSDKSYDELLAVQQAESEDAEDRAGSAGMAAKLLGAFATGHGFQSAGLTFTGKLGAETLGGLPGLIARSAGMAADGAAFGGVDAALNGRDIVREMGTGALLGAGGNSLAEGLGAIGRGWRQGLPSVPSMRHPLPAQKLGFPRFPSTVTIHRYRRPMPAIPVALWVWPPRVSKQVLLAGCIRGDTPPIRLCVRNGNSSMVSLGLRIQPQAEIWMCPMRFHWLTAGQITYQIFDLAPGPTT